MKNKNDIGKFPRWFLISGYFGLIGSGILACCLIWEQTILTWARGPQMVGFSLMHGGGAFLLLFPVLLIIWLISAVILTIRHLIKKRHVARFSWAVLGISMFILILLNLPYGFWQSLFASRLASGAHAGEFLSYAAATRDLRTVKAFLEHGVSVDITDRSGKTGLHSAAVQGHTKVISYLISKGANVNTIDRYGDSPLEIAISEKHDEASK